MEQIYANKFCHFWCRQLHQLRRGATYLTLEGMKQCSAQGHGVRNLITDLGRVNELKMQYVQQDIIMMIQGMYKMQLSFFALVKQDDVLRFTLQEILPFGYICDGLILYMALRTTLCSVYALGMICWLGSVGLYATSVQLGEYIIPISLHGCVCVWQCNSFIIRYFKTVYLVLNFRQLHCTGSVFLTVNL